MTKDWQWCTDLTHLGKGFKHEEAELAGASPQLDYVQWLSGVQFQLGLAARRVPHKTLEHLCIRPFGVP